MTTALMEKSEGVVEADVERVSSVLLDVQIATAKRYARNPQRFRREVEELSLANETVAEACMYAVPRGDKTIEGPSARFGEIALWAYQNAEAGGKVVREDDEFVYALGYFFDLERNVRVTREVRRRITDASGRRYGADMIMVTSNAAASIAQRNAVLAGIPQALWIEIYEKVRTLVTGDIKTLPTRRATAIGWLGKHGIDVKRILAALRKDTVEAIDLDDLARLRGMVTAVKEGEASVDEMFPAPAKESPDAKKGGVAGAKAKLAGGEGTTKAGQEASTGTPPATPDDRGA